MRRQLVPGPVVRLTVIKAKTRPGIEAIHTTIVHALLVALNQVDSQATPFSLIGRGREKRDW